MKNSTNESDAVLLHLRLSLLHTTTSIRRPFVAYNSRSWPCSHAEAVQFHAPFSWDCLLAEGTPSQRSSHGPPHQQTRRRNRHRVRNHLKISVIWGNAVSSRCPVATPPRGDKRPPHAHRSTHECSLLVRLNSPRTELRRR